MVAVGTQQGVWIGKEGDANGLTRVLIVNDVTQIGVLETQNILLVLAGKKDNYKRRTCVSVFANCNCVLPNRQGFNRISPQST
jgi:hypothetical protein